MALRPSHSLILLSALLLGGCETVAAAVVTPIVWQKKHVNLLNSSYAAADNLVYSSSNKLKKSTPLIISDLYEILPERDPTNIYPQAEAHKNPRLGRAITDQIKTRFVQLGYNVVTDYAGGTGGAAEMNGTFEILGDSLSSGDLIVSLRIVDKRTGRVLGLHDYKLPVTSEIKDYMAQGNLVIPSFVRD